MAPLGIGVLIALSGLFCGYDWRSVRYSLHNLLVREKERGREGARERGQERVSVSLFTLCALLLMIIMDMESSNQQVKIFCFSL